MDAPFDIAELWEQHRRWIAAVLLAHKPDEVELDDLLQDVATTVVGRLGELRDRDAVRPWLRSVALNTARMALRRRALRRGVERALDGRDVVHVDPAAARGAARVVDRDRLSHVLGLVQRLPPEYREALLLRAVQGMSQKTVAEVLGVPVTTVETRLARGRALLRRELAARETPAALEARRQ